MVEPGGASEAGAAPSPLDSVRKGFKGLWKAASEGSGEVPGAAAGAATAAGATGDGASVASWTAWADKARRAVANKAREVAYDVVPQADGAASSAAAVPDVERGEAPSPSRWASWAKTAAKSVQKQVTGAAEEARSGIVQVVEKSKSVEWGEQAKGWQSEVSRGLGRVADGAASASSKISEKSKVAQQAAKELQGKSQEKLAEAKAAGAAKAKEAREKAASAAGAAKNKLSQAGQSLSGLTALTMSPAKLAQFGGVFFAGIFLITMSFSFLPLLPIAPQKFALLFAFGSMTLMGSFAILKGPLAFASGLTQREKLPFSVTYVVGLVGTLVATIILKSYLLTALFGLMQAVGLLYFLASHVPGGKACLNFCGNTCARLGGRAARAVALR